MSAASDWVDGLSAEIREFSRVRGTPIVEVHLADGLIVKVQQARPGPGDLFVSFSVFPDVEPGEAVLAAMVKDRDEEYHTARVVVASLHHVIRVELLHDLPAAKTVGFQSPAE
jgi:hypothetical protein